MTLGSSGNAKYEMAQEVPSFLYEMAQDIQSFLLLSAQEVPSVLYEMAQGVQSFLLLFEALASGVVASHASFALDMFLT
jgi:hypothetical protein